MRCPSCGAELRPSALFCWRCGAAVAKDQRASDPSADRPRGRRRRQALMVVAVAAIAVLMAAGYGGLIRHRAVTSAWRGGPAGSGSVTATTPGDLQPGPGVLATPPGNLVPGAGLAQDEAGAAGSAPEDVAAYLRKLEAIQRRDADNPMAELSAMLAAGLSILHSDPLAEEGGSDPTAAGGKLGEFPATLADIGAKKRALLQEFHAISPVPDACRRLHQAYGRYLEAVVQAVEQVEAAVEQKNPAGPLAALPTGRTAERAHAAAAREEEAVRARYHIPRTPERLVP